MTEVRILAEAEAELGAAVAYYENQAPGLGLDFAAEIERLANVIIDYPERWSLRADGTRRCLAQRFPYLLIYAYENNRVWILAIAHCKRRPSYWSNRIRRLK